MTTNGTPNQIPIAERLLADIKASSDSHGKVGMTLRALGKRHGLNVHDLQKNLYQLQKEGLLALTQGRGPDGDGFEIRRLRLRQGAMNDRMLRKKLPVAEQVRQWILNQTTQKNGWIYVTPNQIRERIHVEGNAVNVAVSELQRAGKVETRKEGMRIIAVRLVTQQPPMADPEPEPEERPEPRRFVMPETPELEKYIRARSIASLAPNDNPYVTVTFERNALAEEAAELRAALLNWMGRHGDTLTT